MNHRVGNPITGSILIYFWVLSILIYFWVLISCDGVVGQSAGGALNSTDGFN